MEVLLITVLTFIASIVGTLTGFGSSTIMIPFVVLLFPLPVALLFVGIIHTFNDVWKIILFRHGVKWKLLLTFSIPGIIFSFLGASIALSAESEILKKVLGMILISYVALIIVKPKFKLPHTPLAAASGGSLSGFLAGIFGIGGPVRSMFLTAFNFKKEVYLFTSGVTAIFIDSSRLITYFAGGTRLEDYLGWGLVIFIPVSFLGAEIAKRFVDKIPQKKFRYFVAIFLLLVGLRLLL